MATCLTLCFDPGPRRRISLMLGRGGVSVAVFLSGDVDFSFSLWRCFENSDLPIDDDNDPLLSIRLCRSVIHQTHKRENEEKNERKEKESNVFVPEDADEEDEEEDAEEELEKESLGCNSGVSST